MLISIVEFFTRFSDKLFLFFFLLFLSLCLRSNFELWIVPVPKQMRHYVVCYSISYPFYHRFRLIFLFRLVRILSSIREILWFNIAAKAQIIQQFVEREKKIGFEIKWSGCLCVLNGCHSVIKPFFQFVLIAATNRMLQNWFQINLYFIRFYIFTVTLCVTWLTKIVPE